MLKKIITVIILLVCHQTFAQKNKIEIGLSGGVSSNRINAAYYASINATTANLTSYTINSIVKYKFSNNWGLKTGLNYTKSGGIFKNLQYTDGTTIFTMQESHKLDYLNLPITAEFVSGAKTKIKFNGGFNIGYLVNSRLEIKSVSPPNANMNYEGSLDAYKKLNLSFTIGTGLQIPINKNTLWNFDMAYNLGIFNITKNTPSTATLKSFLITTGLSFPIN